MTEDCCICMATQKLPYKLECGHQFCYLCLKFALMSTTLTCPLCRQEVPVEILEQPHTIHKQNSVRKYTKSSDFENNNETNETKYIWLYAGRHNGHWKYDDTTNVILETEYNQWIQNSNNNDSFESNYQTEIELEEHGFIPINVGGVNKFYFNFKDMYQYNHRNGAKRNIKRLNTEDNNNINIKGTAGLSYK
jgi:hypothetical protein